MNKKRVIKVPPRAEVIREKYALFLEKQSVKLQTYKEHLKLLLEKQTPAFKE